MKKYIIGLLSILMAFCIVGCNTAEHEDSTNSQSGIEDELPENSEGNSNGESQWAPESGLGDNELPLVPIE